jgi:hypothetical protein
VQWPSTQEKISPPAPTPQGALLIWGEELLAPRGDKEFDAGKSIWHIHHHAPTYSLVGMCALAALVDVGCLRRWPQSRGANPGDYLAEIERRRGQGYPLRCDRSLVTRFESR